MDYGISIVALSGFRSIIRGIPSNWITRKGLGSHVAPQNSPRQTTLARLLSKHINEFPEMYLSTQIVTAILQ
jgi:hypothetical protein